ncbi:MAG: dTDP-4-dehydrorhamnose 3,5-epimerase [Methylococcales bacterium]
MEIIETKLPGVLLIKPKYFGDTRGYFMETWNHKKYSERGLNADFVQDNLSFSNNGTLRGLHFQNPVQQGKLVQVLSGEVFDVAVDVRSDSPTFGSWVGLNLSAENHHQLYVPPGFAHGFCVVSDSALFSYKCTQYYSPHCEYNLRWNDPDIAIDWPIENPVLSSKDGTGRCLKDFSKEELPTFFE